jgi:gliding motility-associated-like protein
MCHKILQLSFISLFVLICNNLFGQVTLVKYRLVYDTSSCKYAMYLHIAEGSATSVVHRSQFNSHISLVCSVNDSIEMGSSYNPITLSNGPAPWILNTSNYNCGPAAQPQSCFFDIVPSLSNSPRYSVLSQGDSVKLFDFKIINRSTLEPVLPTACQLPVRIFKNFYEDNLPPSAYDPLDFDPPSSAPGMNGGNFNNGFTLGSTTNIYGGNLPNYIPQVNPKIELVCSEGIYINSDLQLTSPTSCLGISSVSWSGPGFSGSDADVIFPTANSLNNGTYTLTINEETGCTSVKTIDATARANAGADLDICGVTTTTLNGEVSLGATWAQLPSNPAGATIVNPSDPKTSVNFPPNVANTWGFTFGTSDCTDTVYVKVSTKPTITFLGEDKFCPGGSTLITATGGSFYNWAHGPATAAVTINNPGTYVVTVSDGATCVNSASITISQNPSPVAGISGILSFCNNGSTNLTAIGGSNYSWSTGSTAQQIIITAPGSYSVTVTDANNCKDSHDVMVSLNPDPVVVISGPSAVCSGTTGTLTANGGTSYRWQDNSLSNSFVYNSGGTYSVTATDNNGCTGVASALVSIFPLPVASISGDLTICDGQSTVLSANYANSYLWSNFGTTNTISVSNGGTYSVTITDANGCTDDASVTVTTNSLPNALIIGNNSFCVDKTLTLTASGGIAYQWNNLTTANTNTISTGGLVVLTVTDANGCTDTDSKNITVNPLPNPTITGDLDFCNGESTILTAQGGVDFIWSNSSATSQITITDGGLYTVTATDNNGCSNSTSTTVTEYSQNTASISGLTSMCQGNSVVLTATGGPTFLWSNSQTTSSITVNAGGSYSVTATDANGCVAYATHSITFNYNPIPVITGDLNLCQGESSKLTALGGTGYIWSTSQITSSIDVNTAGSYSVTVTDNNGCSSSTSAEVSVFSLPTASISGNTTICNGQTTTLNGSGASYYSWSNGATTPSITLNSAGIVGLTVTDGNGCSNSTSVNIIVNNNPLVAINGDFSICQGENTTLTGVGSGTFQWSTNETTPTIVVSTPGTITLTVTDGNGCSSTSSTNVIVNPLPTATIEGQNNFCAGKNTTITASGGVSYAWSNTAVSPSITVNNPGQYTVTVTDANQCQDTETIDVNVLSQPSVSITGDLEICQAQSTILSVIGGNTFLWSTNETTASITVSSAGSYSCTVTDNNGCTNSASVDVLVNNNPSISINGDFDICQGESTTLTAIGSGQFNWSNASTTSSIEVSNPGVYTVTVTDINGCKSSSSATIDVNALPIAAISGDLNICSGESTPLTASGGIAYIWSNALTNQTISVSSAGQYSVTVTDANGCSDSAFADVSMYNIPSVSLTGDLQICQGEKTTLSVANVGFYSWSTGATTSSIEVNTANTYSCTFTDANGCSDIASATVVVNALPVPSIEGDLSICRGEFTTLIATGGIQYVWNQGQTSSSIVLSENANIVVTVTDANGCSASANAVLTVNELPIAIINGNNKICAGKNTTLTASGGIQYLWSTSEVTPSIQVNTIGTFTVTVTDANQCSDIQTIDVESISTPVVSIDGSLSFCEGGSTTLTAIGSGTYSWSTGATTSSVTISISTPVSVTITDANGCTSSSSEVVNEYSNPIAFIDGNDKFCQGEFTTLTAIGGEQYNWSTGETSAVIIVNDPKWINLTVTDVNGCSASAQMYVSEISAPSVFISGDLEICQGESTTLTANGLGTYTWSTNQNSPSIIVTSGGAFEVTISDNNGCTNASSVVVIENLLPQASISGNPNICEGQSTTLTANGGISYIWHNNTQNKDIVINNSVTAVVTVTDANGCTSVASQEVIKFSNPVAFIDGEKDICEGEYTTLIATGGTLYEWSTSQTTSTITTNVPGIVSLTVTDNNGCTDISQIVINAIPAPNAKILGADALCQGSTITLIAEGGSSYAWHNGSTSSSIVIDKATNARVTVTDASGCSAIATKDITVNALPNAQINGDLDFCKNGQTTLTGVGGSSYIWSNTQTTESITVFTPGQFTITVTDANGCSSSNTVSVVENALPIASVSGPNETCQGNSEVITASGGISYNWSSLGTTPAITVSTPNLYTVTVTDINGCTSTASHRFDVKPKPNAGATQSVLCNITGKATMAAQGLGTWSLGFSAGTATIADAQNPNTEVSGFSAPGTYIMVWNVNGCLDTAFINVSAQCNCPINQNTISLDNKSYCKEAKNITIAGETPQPANGIFEWEYSFNGGVFQKLPNTNAQALTIPSLAVGTHAYRRLYTTTDGIICTDISNLLEISVHPEPIASIAGDNNSCGKDITLTASGGDFYNWENGASTVANFIAKTSGTYSVIVTNFNGCSASATKSITIHPSVNASIEGPTEICDGKVATLVAKGGSQYAWSNGTNNDTLTTNAAGTYAVVVTDSNGCSNFAEHTLTITDNPVANINGPSLMCIGQTITLTAPTGISYNWSNAQTTSSIQVDAPGTYNVTVVDATGCVSLGSKIIALHNPTPLTISGNDAFCEGTSTELSAVGGTSFTWSGGINTQKIIIENPGTYSVTATDANGCTTEASKVVSLLPKPSAMITGDHGFCQGLSITLTASNASTYLWNQGGVTSQSLTVNAPGAYKVSITGSNGCLDSTTHLVEMWPLPAANIDGPDEICVGSAAQLIAQGGQSYIWSNASTDKTINTSIPGIYLVTVTDANGCQSSAVKTLIVTNNPVANISGDIDICEGESTVLSTTNAQSYLWSNGETTQAITVSNSGTYAVTIIDANNCEAKGFKTVTVNVSPIAAISGDLTICDGEVSNITANGGIAYLWHNGSTTSFIEWNTTSQISVTVTDNNGCTDTELANFIANPKPSASINGADQICLGASTEYVAIGDGDYLWSTTSTSPTITVNQAGTYQVTVTNSFGCSSVASKTLTITENPIAFISGNPRFCVGESTTLAAQTGASYQWSGSYGTNQSIIVSTPGTVTVSVTDASGCVAIGSVDVQEAPIPNASISGAEQICLGSSTVFTAGGGRSYIWNTGEITQSITVSNSDHYTVTVTSDNGCTDVANKSLEAVSSPVATIEGITSFCQGGKTKLTAAGIGTFVWATGETTAAIEVSTPGIYRVTVTDPSGCEALGQVEVSMNPNPTIEISGTLTICEGSQTLLSASTADYYLWSNGETNASILVDKSDTYSVIVTDIHGCSATANKTVVVHPNPVPLISGPDEICTGSQAIWVVSGGSTYKWEHGPETAQITIDKDGFYAVTITNDNGCSAIASKELKISENPSIDINGIPSVCSGGSTTLSVPNSYVSYLWSNNATTSSIVVDQAGLVLVTVTDNNNCMLKGEILVAQINGPLGFISGTPNICQGANTTLTASGGSSYVWADGSTAQSIIVNEDIIYSVTITDANGCKDTVSQKVSFYPSPIVDFIGSTSFCLGGSTQITALGGTSFAWEHGPDTPTINIQASGEYVVSVTDANGCKASDKITITEMPALNTDISGPIEICNGSSAILTAINGTSYIWSTNETTSSITVADAKTYFVTVTDANGCSGTASHSLTVSNNPTIEIQGDKSICQGDSTLLSVSGVGAFLWSNGSTQQAIYVSQAGTINLTLLDANGCAFKGQANIVVHPNPTAVVSGDKEFCEGQTVALKAQGGSSYLWSNGNTTDSLVVNATSNYQLTITDANGCKNVTSGSVTAHPLPTATIIGELAFCQGSSTMLVAQGNGAFRWSDGSSIDSISVTTGGTYILTVTSDKGCISTTSATVSAYQNPTASIQSSGAACEGEKITLSAAGANIFLWSNGSTTNSIQVTNAGSFEVTVTDNNNCSDKADIVVSFYPVPKAGSDKSVNCYKTGIVTLDAQGQGTWSVIGNQNGIKISNTNDPKSAASFTEAGEYRLIWTSSEGCEDTVIVSAKPYCDCTIENNEIERPVPAIFCDEVTGIVIKGSEARPDGGIYTWLYSFNNIPSQIAPGVSNTKDYITPTLKAGTHRFRRVYDVQQPVVCSDTSDFVTIVVREATLPTPFDASIAPNPICLGDTVFLNVSGDPSARFVWSVDNANANIASSNTSATIMIPSAAGVYKVSVHQVADECELKSETLTFEVLVNALPTLELGPDSIICELDGPFALKIDEYSQIEWTTGHTLPEINIEKDGVYGVTVTNQEGCSRYDEIELKHFCCKIFYPNIIYLTSNNYKNREFALSHTDCVIKSSLTIYDRWGNLVYKSNDGLAPWDGTFNGQDVEQGVYTFLFTYVALDENDQEFEDKVSGDVTVIR